MAYLAQPFCMIKVIKEGKLPSKKYTGACVNCGAIIEAEATDHSADWLPSKRKNSKISVDCPTKDCNHPILCKPIQ